MSSGVPAIRRHEGNPNKRALLYNFTIKENEPRKGAGCWKKKKSSLVLVTRRSPFFARPRRLLCPTARLFWPLRPGNVLVCRVVLCQLLETEDPPSVPFFSYYLFLSHLLFLLLQNICSELRSRRVHGNLCRVALSDKVKRKMSRFTEVLKGPMS